MITCRRVRAASPEFRVDALGAPEQWVEKAVPPEAARRLTDESANVETAAYGPHPRSLCLCFSRRSNSSLETRRRPYSNQNTA